MCSSPDGSARCRLAVLLRSEQHAVMPVGGLLFLRSPVVVIVHPGEKPRVCVEKASRSTLVDVRSDAQIGITVILANAFEFDMDREMLIVHVTWCQPQDADDGQPKEGWT
ncbi:hypothetical protein Zm00014a_023118 [Zea mays]|uniref:Uncharacterized protein n=1 Tax=Zea mays TaxID=4577 RepID=A0A3L6FXW1_MAIZE|nr:hypothetical protein Zm00014a_023118 [Zea mays]